MSTKIRAASVALILVVAAVPARVAAEDGPKAAAVLANNSRVRGVDSESRRLLESAVASSPTVARMVAELQSSDLIVYVEIDGFLAPVRGEMLLLRSTLGVRPVRIKIRASPFPSEMISLLGHELQHALEVAAAPEVRDAATQTSLYQRIGWETAKTGYFETTAAIEAGRRVAAEVAASRPPRRDTR